MRKNILIMLLGLFSCATMYGQLTYTITVSGEPGGEGTSNPAPRRGTLQVARYDGTKYTDFIILANSQTNSSDADWNVYNFNLPYMPDIILTRSHSGTYDEPISNFCWYKIINGGRCWIGNYGDNDQRIKFCNTTSDFKAYNISVLPNMDVTSSLPTNSEICEKFTLTVNPPLSGTHVWEYRVGNNPWKVHSPSFGKSTITLGLEDFPEAKLGDNVNLRYKICSSRVRSWTYTFIACSPGLSSGPTANQPTCNGEKGGFTAQFDRVLDPAKNERMLVYIEKNFGPGIGFATYSEGGNRIILPNQLTNRTLIWGNTLPDGIYRMRWISKNGSDPSSNPNADETSTSFEIKSPPPLSVSGTPTNNNCFGGKQGVITATTSLAANGGVPPYQYSINGGTNYQTSNIFNNLASGTYTITIKDDKGCTKPSTLITVRDLATSKPKVELNPANLNNPFRPTQPGATDGAIDIFTTGGSGGYTYRWTKGTPPNDTFYSSNQDLAGIGQGKYTIIVTDSNGCASDPVTYTIVDLEALRIQFSTSPKTLDCHDSTANITAQGFGGASEVDDSYTYLWEYQNTTSKTISGVKSGVYKVTIKDKNGTPFIDSYTLESPLEITLAQTPKITDVTCRGGNDGIIELDINGGALPGITPDPSLYETIWTKNGDPFTPPTGSTNTKIIDLEAGYYDYQITYNGKCAVTNTQIIEVEEPLVSVEVFEIEASHVDNIIFDGNAGILEIGVLNNTGITAFSWFKDGAPFTPSAGSTNTRLTDLEAGEYTLEFIDAILCDATLSKPIVIKQPEPLKIESSNTTNSTCYKYNDAQISVVVIGGYGKYSYAWSKEGDTQFSRPNTDSTIEKLEPGKYTVTVSDEGGAIITSDIFDITEPDLLEIKEENVIPVVCFGESSGTIDVSIVGGTPPYTIVWNNGETTQDIQNLTTGTYIIQVEDDKGCFAEKHIAVRNQKNQLQIQKYKPTHLTAFESGDGKIELQLTGGAQPYDITWKRLSDNAMIGNTSTINQLSADTYQVTIKDGSDCILEASYEITQPDIVESQIVNPTCFQGCDGSIALEVNKGQGNFTYQWDNGATTQLITELCAGSYTVTILGFDNRTLVRTYELIDPDPVRVDLGEDKTICVNQTTSFSAKIDDPSATYSWTSDNGFKSDQANITIDKAGIYSVIVTTSIGCVAEDTVVVKAVDAEIKAEFLYASQVITNETFTIIDVTYPAPDTIEWIVPETAQVVTRDQDLIELYFENEGEYEISVLAQFGDCQDIYTQKVLVIKGEDLGQQQPDGDITTSENSTGVQEFSVYPNPSDGKFAVKVVLKDKKEISLKIFNLTNNTLLAHEKAAGNKTYEIPFNMQVASGIYAMVLETPYGNAIRKVIVK